MKKSLLGISEFLKKFEYEFDYDEKEGMIFCSEFTISREKDKFGIDFSLDTTPDFVAILMQRLSREFGKFDIYESWYFYPRDNELYYGDEALGCYMHSITEQGMNIIFDDFRMMNSSQNLYTPSFQSQKDPRNMIKVMLSDRWKEEDAIKCQKFFEDKGCKILIVWDHELNENKEQLTEKIKTFLAEDVSNVKEFLATA